MDETEYPPNVKTKREVVAKPEEKKVESVVVGKVVRRKPTLGRRLRETFIGGETKSVGSYILFEVLIPAFKDVVADAVSQAIERMLFGEGRSSNRRTGQRPGGTTGHVSYNRYSSSSSAWRRDEPRNHISKQARRSHDFDEIILNTRAEAETVIERLFDLVERYGQATVSDLYELTGLEGTFMDEKWGWTDIRGAGVTRITNGYLLDIPRPEPLD